MNQDDEPSPHQRDVLAAMRGAERDEDLGDPLVPVFVAAIIGGVVTIIVAAIIIF